jgi:dephospho-CoA kinase
VRIRVVSLAGRRGSGKSAIASTLQRSGFALAAFGGFVRAVATARGIDHEVPALEALGTTLIVELGWENFCRQVLAGTESAHRVVVDGVRHCAAREALRRIALPYRAALVFVDVDEDERARRLRERGRPGDDRSTPEMSDEVDELREGADFVVSGSGDLAAEQVRAWIEASERS